MAGSKPHIVLVGGDASPSGVPRHITNLARALQNEARLTILSEANKGGYDEIRPLGAEHVTLQGLASSFNLLHLTKGQSALADWLSRNPSDLIWGHARMPVTYLRRLIRSGTWRPAPGAKLALSYHGLPVGAGARFGMNTFSLHTERRLLKGCPTLELVFLTEDQKSRMKDAIGSDIDHHVCHVLSNASHLGPLRNAAPRDVQG